MSSSPGTREVAHRVFAAEFDDADFSYSESDEERAPNYVVTPSGARVNRLFLVGVLTETEQVNEDMLRARVVDPTGAFVTYAGQYQPDELAFLERTDPPAFLAVTGKARTFQPEDSDRIYTSVRPESISQVDADTRDRWVVQAAERTHERVRVMASAIESGLEGEQLEAALRAAGIEGSLAEGVALALDHYGTTPAYLAELHDTAVEAARMVAGEVDEARRPTLAPDEGDGDAGTLADPDLVDELASAAAAAPEPGAPAPEAEPAGEGAATEEPTAEPTAEATAEAETEPGTEVEAEPEAETEVTPESAETAEEATAEPGTEPATEAAAAEEPVVESEDVPATEDERAVEAAEPEPESTVESEEPVAEAGSEPAVEGVESEEPAVEPTDVPSTETESAGEAAEELGEFEPGELDVEEEPEEALTEEERQQVEEEFGTDFSTGKEVEPEPELGVEEEPAESGAEAEGEAEEAAESEAEAVEAEAEPEAEEAAEAEAAEAEPEPEAVEEGAGEVDLETAVMDAMRDLDEGEGADRDAVITAVVEEHGVAAGEVEDAIQDALMSGQCYEPADGKLKPI